MLPTTTEKIKKNDVLVQVKDWMTFFSAEFSS